MPETPSDAPRLLSRRTLAKGAVWSVPVVASVTLAPQAAASPAATVSITATCGSSNTFVVTVTKGTLDVGTAFSVSATGLTLNAANVSINNNGIFTKTSGTSTPVVFQNLTVAAPQGTTFTVTVTPPAVVGLVVYSITGQNKTAQLSYLTALGTTCTPVSAA